MNKQQVLEKINAEKLVPVIRTPDIETARRAIEIIGDCGIGIFEITLTIPNAVNLIEEFSASDYLIGAGTVLTVEQAQECVAAGAKFIVSPVFNEEIVRHCAEKSVAVMAAGLTPTEVYNAWQSGADCVKIFPCETMGGAKYIKALKSVFPHINVMPTGGVSLETVEDFIRAGSFAVGVGADLVDLKAIAAGKTDLIAAKAERFLSIIDWTNI